MMKTTQLLTPLATVMSAVSAIQLDITSIDSVKTATSSIAYDMMTYYSGNQSGQVPGILPGPCASDSCYYWWEAGAMWAALINYQQYTGDTSYQDVVLQSLEFQVGPDYNYNPTNQSSDMGIDDQDFWGFAAMEAAEAGVPDSKVAGIPSWVALAQGVWNSQYVLWDSATCGGGFRWQVYKWNKGYNLKNTISNGGFFQLSARLARYTNNQTYVEWAEKVWDWLEQSPLFATENGQLYLWDNTDADTNCTTIENFVWTYNYGTLMVGAAYLYNMTNGSTLWGGRVQQIWDGASTLFYKNDVMYEYLCEAAKNCDNDQSSFKAYLARWSAVTMTLAPFMWPQIWPQLQASANGAAGQCIGGSNGRMCGRQWYSTTWDGSSGVGQQMSALAVIGATQMSYDIAPKSLMTGATSPSDPNAGSAPAAETPQEYLAKHPMTTADKAGAGILTFLIIVSVLGLCAWLII